MTYADEAVTIRQRFRSNWLSTPIAWPNADFDEPESDAWVRLNIVTAQSEQTTTGAVGSRDFRHVGMVVVQVFVPKNTGDGYAKELADSACAVFRGVSEDGITFLAPYVEPGPDDPKWFQVNATCPYFRDSQF